ncbi:MAG: DNA N-6-adenine-methyltransferase [Verrucomicrobiota bacterium]
MSEPTQKPGQSEQIVGTPPQFIDAVERQFGPITWDLAALSSNRVRQVGWFGPGSPDGEDALVQPWHNHTRGLQWLNPGFGKIGQWAAKCREEGAKGASIAMLVPLSSSNWARDYVHGRALVLGLNPRLKFIGHRIVFPKDLMLCLYGPGFTPGFTIWQWNR